MFEIIVVKTIGFNCVIPKFANNTTNYFTH
jgi:hypothetical protein